MKGFSRFCMMLVELGLFGFGTLWFVENHKSFLKPESQPIVAQPAVMTQVQPIECPEVVVDMSQAQCIWSACTSDIADKVQWRKQ